MTIPSFVSLTECGQIIIAASNNSMQLRQWRFDNLKGKILFQRDFIKQITADIPLICTIEGADAPNTKWAINMSYAQSHYELMLALKLSYLVRRVKSDFQLQNGIPLWSLPLPVTSVSSREAAAMQRAYAFGLKASTNDQTSKGIYTLTQYNKLLGDYKQFRSNASHLESVIYRLCLKVFAT